MKTIGKILLLAGVMLIAVSKTNAQISLSISVGVAPPVMPVYVQPACPTDGYLWQPGYWAYDNADGYYWVPGVWVAPPQPGYLWTPCYWGYEGGHYGFHQGYWGVSVGFYGGINYGFGYGGWGFGGGSWSGGHFRYNTAVVNVNRTVIHNTYIDRTVIRNTYVSNHTSFNGPGGVTAKPRPEELTAMKQTHIQPTSEQLSHEHAASQDKSQFASVNHGHPAAAAMDKVGGHPYNAKGSVSKTSSLGHANAAVKKGPATTASRTATHANRATTHAKRPAATTSHAAAPKHPAATTKRTAAPNRPAATTKRGAAAANHPAAKTGHPAATQKPAKQQPRPQAHTATKPKAAEPLEKKN